MKTGPLGKAGNKTGNGQRAGLDTSSPGQGSFRCFVAIRVPEETRSFLASFVAGSKGLFPGYRFVSPENLHITIQFLGEVPARSLPALREALEAATEGREPFRVSFSEAGAFPDRGVPRILHVVATGGNNPLRSLAEGVRDNLYSLGYGDSKPFAPHITLARERKRPGGANRGSNAGAVARKAPDIRSLWKDSFRQFLEQMNVRPEWDVAEVVLMRSILKPDGAVYSPLAALALGGS